MRHVLLPYLTLLCVVLILLPFGSSGCAQPPANTLFLDLDEDGKQDALVWDRNGDGEPDMIPLMQDVVDEQGQPVLDEQGQPKRELVIDEASGLPVMVPDVVPGSGMYRTAEKVDAIAPAALGVAGAIAGGTGWLAAILAGMGLAWKSVRFGRVFANTVMAFQIGRQRLKDGGHEEALKMLDEALQSGQLQATQEMIAEIKRRMGVKSVTDAPPK